jgi:transcriptional regulator of arginine metabolism
MSTKLRRLNRIKELLNNRYIASHEILAKLLNDEGVPATQATLSRDFAELGVVRINTEKGARYVLDAQESGKQIARMIGFEILSVHHNEHLIVIRTLAGRAQGVAHYIDRLNKHEILGTVGGDDTVIVIPSGQKHLHELINFIKIMMTEQNGLKPNQSKS